MNPEEILDFNSPFDTGKVDMLDRIMNILYGPSNPQDRDMAHKIINEFKQNPQAWLYADTILEMSNSPNTKFFALSILEDAINVSRILYL